MKTSDIIIGTMRLGQWGAQLTIDEYEKFIDQCIELGLKDFDHADIYGDFTTETEFGDVLKRRPDLRQKLRVTTKCGIRMAAENRPENSLKSYDLSPKYITYSVEHSLRNFGTDYIDTLLLHRPDFLMHPQKIAECINSLIASGKVLHFGVSNFNNSQIALLKKYVSIENHQFQFSIDHTDPLTDGTIDYCQMEKIKATAWSPLGGGFLFEDITTNKKSRILNTSRRLAEKYNCSLDQLLISWILKHPANITPVLGTTKILRLASALEAKKVKLSSEDWYAMYKSSTGEELA